MDELKSKKQIIKEICLEKGIEKVDISYDWISVLKKGEKEAKLMNYQFGLNSLISSKLARDKYATYEVLKYHQIPMIEHKVLFNQQIMPDVEVINQNYQILKNDEKQVIKANDSSQGKDVYVCQEENKKIQLVDEMFERQIEAVVVCPYLEIEYEYRALYLDGEIIYIYKKQKPFVVGNGKLTIQELIQKQLKYLQEPMEGLNFAYIPEKNERVIVGWKHNLSNGAIPVLVDEEEPYYQEIKKMAKQVRKSNGTYVFFD